MGKSLQFVLAALALQASGTWAGPDSAPGDIVPQEMAPISNDQNSAPMNNPVDAETLKFALEILAAAQQEDLEEAEIGLAEPGVEVKRDEDNLDERQEIFVNPLRPGTELIDEVLDDDSPNQRSTSAEVDESDANKLKKRQGLGFGGLFPFGNLGGGGGGNPFNLGNLGNIFGGNGIPTGRVPGVPNNLPTGTRVPGGQGNIRPTGVIPNVAPVGGQTGRPRPTGAGGSNNNNPRPTRLPTAQQQPNVAPTSRRPNPLTRTAQAVQAGASLTRRPLILATGVISAGPAAVPTTLSTRRVRPTQ